MPSFALHLNGQACGFRVMRADRWYQRAVGLLLTPSLQDPVGLWLAPCSAVHMLGMRYALDLVFLDRDGRVMRLVRGLKPWRFAACRGAHAVLELRPGLIDTLALHAGQRVTLPDC